MTTSPTRPPVRPDREALFSVQEREDDMLIAERDWQFGWRCIARRPKSMTNDEWRPVAERIIAALTPTSEAERVEGIIVPVEQLREWYTASFAAEVALTPQDEDAPDRPTPRHIREMEAILLAYTPRPAPADDPAAGMAGERDGGEVERVARAICRHNYPGGSAADIDEMWDGWKGEAEAAIAALHPPPQNSRTAAPSTDVQDGDGALHGTGVSLKAGHITEVEAMREACAKLVTGWLESWQIAAIRVLPITTAAGEAGEVGHG